MTIYKDDIRCKGCKINNKCQADPKECSCCDSLVKGMCGESCDSYVYKTPLGE